MDQRYQMCNGNILTYPYIPYNWPYNTLVGALVGALYVHLYVQRVTSPGLSRKALYLFLLLLALVQCLFPE